MPDYQVKNVKTFMGSDAPGYNATLYCDGRKVADVIDDGSGGCAQYHWAGLACHSTQYDPNHPDARQLHEHVRNLPLTIDPELKHEDGTPFAYAQDADTFVAGLVNAELQRRDLQKLLRNRIVLKLPDGNVVTVGTKALKPTDTHLDSIMRQYSDAVCLNRVPFDVALRAYRGEA